MKIIDLIKLLWEFDLDTEIIILNSPLGYNETPIKTVVFKNGIAVIKPDVGSDF